MLRKLALVVLLVMSLSGLAFAQSPTAHITGNATGIHGTDTTPYPVSLQVQVVGCGTEVPHVIPSGSVITNTYKQTAPPPSLAVDIQVFGNDVIKCGTQTYTMYAATWLINGFPAAPTAQYRVNQGGTCNISDGSCLPIGFTPPIIANGTGKLCPDTKPFLQGFTNNYVPVCSAGQVGPPGPAGAGGVDASTYCDAPGTLNDSCLVNAMAVANNINLSGVYNLSGTTISKANVHLQCSAGGGIVQVIAGTPALSVTGDGTIIDGCSLAAIGTAQPAIQVGAPGDGVNGFIFRNGTTTNSTADYTIRVDSSDHVQFTGNVLNNSKGAIQTFASSNVSIIGNQGLGAFNVESPGTGGSGSSVVIANNSLTPPAGGTIATVGDFSGSTNPIDSLAVTGNTCRITGTSAPAQPFGCFSIVNKVSKCSITGNTLAGDGEWIGYAMIELGTENCTVTANSITANDAHSQGYYGIVTYGGHNNIVGNTIHGWGAGADAIRLYAQTAAGTANDSADNLIMGNNIIGTAANSTSSKGIHLICNVAGSNIFNQKVIGNTVTSAAAELQWGIGVENALGATCPGSTTISENLVGATQFGIVVMNVDNTIGRNDIGAASVSKVFHGGTGTASNNTIDTGVETPIVVPTALTPSVQGLCYPNAGQSITNVGCAAVNRGQVTFTPTGVGWYRIISGGTLGIDRGDVDIYAYYTGANYPANKVTFSINAFGGTSTVKVTNLGLYGGSYGAIDQIRASTDGVTALYLDVHVATVTGVTPISMTFTGLAMDSGDIVTNPVVGAVVGSSSVATLDFTTFPLGPAVGEAQTGQYRGGSFVASSDGFDAASGGYKIAGSYGSNGAIMTSNGSATFWSLPIHQVASAAFTTTAATTENVPITGIDATWAACVFAPSDVNAATNVATSYTTAINTGSVTFNHAAIAGMTYSFTCSRF